MYSKLLLNRKKIMFILAIGAGALLGSPSVHALPEQSGFITSGVNIDSDGETMNITGSDNNNNNVINWSSFNIGKDETVQYDQNNYLNLIHDPEASQINGKITGGKNIYLINPNGVLFGDNSSVNVGNLYVSTRPLDGNDFDDYVNSDGFLNATTNLTGDIVNLGKMQATQVVLEGNNVTLKNAIDIMNQSDDARNDKVTINAVNSIEIGNADNVDNIWTHNIGITKFNLISRFDELKNMQSGMNYMLANDIDAASYAWDGVCDDDRSPIKFNGLNHKIYNLLIGNENSEKRKSHIGIFGDLHGVVKNVSIVNSKVYGEEDVGLLVGYMYKDAVVDNCHSIGSEVHGIEFAGGLVGAANGGTITNSTNSSKVYGWNCVGGIVGITDTYDFALKNCQNSGDVQCYFDEGYADGHPHSDEDRYRYYNSFTGGLIGCAHYSFFGTDCIIEDSSNSGYVKGTTNVGGLVGIYGGKSSITGCINVGTVKGSANIGGLVGNYSPETNDSTIKNCINKGNVIVTGTDSPLTAGELVGGYWNGKISDNYSEGIVKYGATYDNDSEEGLATTNELVGDTYFDKDEIRQLNQKPSIQTDSGIQINSDNHTGRGITIKPGIIKPLSPIKPSEKPIIPADLSDKQNAINDGLKEADCLKSLFNNDFQNFSKGSSLISETIQATNDDEEKASSHLVLED